MDITNKLDLYMGHPQNEGVTKDIAVKTIKVSSGVIKSAMNAGVRGLQNLGPREVINLLSGSFRNMLDLVVMAGYEEEVLAIINAQLRTKFTSLDQISRLRVLGRDDMRKGDNMRKAVDEGIANKLMAVSKIAKVFKSMSNIVHRSGYQGDAKMMIVYSILWVLLTSGKVTLSMVKGGRF